MENSDEITLNIRPLGAKKFSIQVAPHLALADLRKTIANHLGGGHVRLLHKGRQLTNGSVTNAGLTTNSAITVIRSSAASVDAVRSLREDTLLRGIATTEKQPRYIATPATSAKRPSLFGETRALPQYADWRDALEILDDLATHPGFHAAMSKRHWHVGLLAEMPPTGRVGVDPVCVLGYNVNKGMEIHLRLRTDDELGFRPIHKLYEVLAHELAHCEHSDHGDMFKQLMLDVQREAEEGDWRYSTGRVLGDGGIVRNNVPGSRRRLAEIAPPIRRASAARSRLVREHEQGRVRNNMTRGKSNENVVAEKVDENIEAQKIHESEKRGKSKENVDAEKVHKNDDAQNCCCEKSSNDIDKHERTCESDENATTTEPRISKDDQHQQATVPVTHKNDTNAVVQGTGDARVRPDSQQLSTLLAMGVERELAIIGLRMCKNEVTAALDYVFSPPPTNFGALHSTPLASELRLLLDVLSSEVTQLDTYLRTLQLLHTYLNNVVQYAGNVRYRTINAANSTFTTFVSRYPSATNYLTKSGFSLESSTNRWTAQDCVSVHILSAGILLERLLSLVHH